MAAKLPRGTLEYFVAKTLHYLYMRDRMRYWTAAEISSAIAVNHIRVGSANLSPTRVAMIITTGAIAPYCHVEDQYCRPKSANRYRWGGCSPYPEFGAGDDGNA